MAIGKLTGNDDGTETEFKRTVRYFFMPLFTKKKIFT